jgi:histidine triad (HIT) family protein
VADCIFCSIIAGDLPGHVIAEDDQTLAFLDIMPFARGHTLVIPKVHTEDFWSVEVATAQAMIATAHRVGAMARENLGADGLNLFQATRAVAWQTVFHVHLHVIPRWEGDGFEQPGWASPMAEQDVLDAVATDLRG